MTKIIYRKESLFDAKERHIIHGCNSRGAYASGVAGRMREIYPKAYRVYRDLFEERGLELGETIWADCGRHVVINAITQDDYGRDPARVYVSYAAIRVVMRHINLMSTQSPRVTMGELKELAMPCIGAGLANGSWQIISEIIEEELINVTPVVYLNGERIPQS